jgi:uncharacterized protein YbjT (DUF2867 family)
MSAMSKPALTLVFGASGYIGRRLVPHLLNAGHPVRAAARDTDALKMQAWRDVECVRADALEPDTLPAVVEGIDIAFYLVHSMAAGPDFGALDLQAAGHFRDAAAAAGVGRIVYLGGLIPENPESEHLRSRYETGECLRAGPVPVTEVRSAMIIGPGSAAFEVMRDLVNYLPLMITPRWVYSNSPPIALADLLDDLVAVAELDGAAGRVYDAGGPEHVTYAAQMRRLGARIGKNPRILPVPVLTPKLSSYWLGLITSVPVNIARALIDGLRHDVTADDRALRELVPRKLQGLDEAFDTALNEERRHDVPVSWQVDDVLGDVLKPGYSFYALRASGSCWTDAEPAAVWAELCRFGTGKDFFALNTLWWIRGAMDWVVGGPAFRRDRRDPDELRVGDVVDSWRVIALEEGRRILLLMEMKAPGCGVLELETVPVDGELKRGLEIRATAHWYPAGVLGLLYWHPLFPFHQVIFKRMTREVARRAVTRGGGAEAKA